MRKLLVNVALVIVCQHICHLWCKVEWPFCVWWNKFQPIKKFILKFLWSFQPPWLILKKRVTNQKKVTHIPLSAQIWEHHIMESVVLLLACKIPYGNFHVKVIHKNLDIYPLCSFGPFIWIIETTFERFSQFNDFHQWNEMWSDSFFKTPSHWSS
jgi:hypothetical protein